MRVIIAGDYCPRYRVAPFVETMDMSLYGAVPEVIERESDYAIVNLECPVVIRDANPIEKLGPNLKCSRSTISSLYECGFRCVTLANNHIGDFGRIGIEDTIIACKESGMDYVGVGKTIQDASKIHYFSANNKRLSVINCCEHEFSIATKDSAGATPLDLVLQYNQILEARANSDYVIVIIHGGHEHWPYPSKRMVNAYRFFIDVGADAVINHHQHCYSGYEYYKNRPIFYGLGNFCFDQYPVSEEKLWNYGYLVKLSLNEEGVKHEIIPYKQCGNCVGIQLLPNDAFDTSIRSINETIANGSLLDQVNDEFYHAFMKDMEEIIQPIQRKIISSFRYRGLLPSFHGKKWLINLSNFVSCESHRELFEYYLNNK